MPPSSASDRLAQVSRVMAPTMQLDKNSYSLPRRRDLPKIPGAPEGAAWFWGAEDELGRINLLTPARVKEAVKEVRSGEIVPLNLELRELHPTCFNRDEFQHTIRDFSGSGVAFDDFYTLNTQSSTQWDGFRHFSHLASGTFYNGAKGSDFQGPNASSKCGIHSWSQHGVVARGILLDFASYAEIHNIVLDHYQNDKIPYGTLVNVGKSQGIDIRPESQGGDIKIGDILLVRSGFLKNYRSIGDEERTKMHKGEHKFGPDDGQRYAGIEQSEEILDWLHDCYFAGVAGDMPAFEAWPSKKEYYLHEHLLALWGCPIGELWDLEKLAEKCIQRESWTFLLTSSPTNVEGGVASHANAMAIL